MEEIGITLLQPPEQKPQSQKANQNEKKKKRITSQMKKQDKSPEKQLNEVEIGNLPEKEVRIMIAKMIQHLRKRMEKMQDMFTKDLEALKNRNEQYTRKNQ